MSNIVNPNNTGALPAAFRGMFQQGGPVNDDLSAGVGVGFAHLSIKGKVFHIHDGDDIELQTNPDNRTMPAQYLDVCLVKASREMSKVFYLQQFTEGSDAKPDCFSNNGITPDPQSPAPQAQACAACPNNQWGSRQSDDGNGSGKGKACQDARRMAVSLVEEIDFPMLLRVPPVTLKELAAYGSMLSKRGVPYQAVVTRIFFDHTVAFPKLQFQAVRFLTDEEAATVKDMMDGDDLVDQIIGANAIAARNAAQAAAPALTGQMPQAMQNVQAQQTQAAPAPAPAPAPVQQQPVNNGMGADMFGGQPQTQAAPVQQQQAAPEPEKPKRRRKASEAPAQTQQQAPVNNVVQMQQQPQNTQVLQPGAATEGVNVVGGDLAAGLDSLLGGLPDVPNI